MLHLFIEAKAMGSAKKRQKEWFVLLAIAFPFLYFKCYEIF
jgi:hypothetical protein